MKKIDFSLMALVFFITRTIFKVTSTTNIFVSLIVMVISFIILLFLLNKKIIINKTIVIIIGFIFCILTMRSTTNFIFTNYFIDANLYIIKIVLLFAIYTIIKDDNNSIKSCSEILFFLFIIFFIIVITNSLKYINISNLITPFTKYKFNIIDFLPLIFVFILPSLNKSNNEGEILYSFIFAVITIIIQTLITYGVLGINLSNLTDYPSIMLLKQLPYFSFSNRLDSLFLVFFIFEDTMTLAFILYLIKKRKTWYYYLSLGILAFI